jgi:hypothetical protein
MEDLKDWSLPAQIAMQISLLEKSILVPAEVDYVALYSTNTEFNFIPASSFIKAHGTGKHLIFF